MEVDCLLGFRSDSGAPEGDANLPPNSHQRALCNCFHLRSSVAMTSQPAPNTRDRHHRIAPPKPCYRSSARGEILEQLIPETKSGAKIFYIFLPVFVTDMKQMG
jgi:hypothetical protein